MLQTPFFPARWCCIRRPLHLALTSLAVCPDAFSYFPVDSAVAVVAAIVKSGLRIMPHSGGRVGRGIYLASENAKRCVCAYSGCACEGPREKGEWCKHACTQPAVCAFALNSLDTLKCVLLLVVRDAHAVLASRCPGRGALLDPTARISWRDAFLSRQYVRPVYGAKGAGVNLGVMFLCEAALGKEASITVDDFKLTEPPPVRLRKRERLPEVPVASSCCATPTLGTTGPLRVFRDGLLQSTKRMGLAVDV